MTATRPIILPMLLSVLALLIFRAFIVRPGYNVRPGPYPIIGERIVPISQWRTDYRRLLNDTAHPDRAPILNALILGERKGIPRPTMKLLYRLGVGHLLAISGLHIGLVAGISLWALSHVIPGHRLVTSILAFLPALLYSSIVPLRHSTLRALIMVAVFLAARVRGTILERRQVIILAAVVILLAQPLALFDAGFQLSFAAVLALSAFLPPFLRWGKPETRVGRYILAMLGASCICTVALAPILLWHFGQAPTIGPITNCLVIPPVTIAVGLLLSAFILFLVLPPLSPLLIHIADYSIFLSMSLINTLAIIPIPPVQL